MMRMMFVMADTLMCAEFGCDNRWHVECQDMMTGKREGAVWTNDEFASIMALFLGVGEDKTPGFDHTELYKTCEPLLASWPKEVRPIP